jgi:hypothetical protein
VPDDLIAQKPKKLSAADIRVALERRYCAPEWCLMHEAANGTGFSGKRYADCVAMNLFPSRGLAIHGLEIKVSRSDLTKELKNPNKADEIAQYCDLWYVVTPKVRNTLRSKLTDIEAVLRKFGIEEKAA